MTDLTNNEKVIFSKGYMKGYNKALLHHGIITQEDYDKSLMLE